MHFLSRMFEDRRTLLIKTHNEIFYAFIYVNAFLIFFAVGKTENLTNLVSFFANYIKIDVWSLYFFLLLGYGLVAALMYRFGTNGPANPFAQDSLESSIFWVFVVSGPIGYIISSIIFVRHTYVERKLQKEMIASWAYKPKKPVEKNSNDISFDDRIRLLM